MRSATATATAATAAGTTTTGHAAPARAVTAPAQAVTALAAAAAAAACQAAARPRMAAAASAPQFDARHIARRTGSIARIRASARRGRRCCRGALLRRHWCCTTQRGTVHRLPRLAAAAEVRAAGHAGAWERQRYLRCQGCARERRRDASAGAGGQTEEEGCCDNWQQCQRRWCEPKHGQGRRQTHLQWLAASDGVTGFSRRGGDVRADKTHEPRSVRYSVYSMALREVPCLTRVHILAHNNL